MEGGIEIFSGQTIFCVFLCLCKQFFSGCIFLLTIFWCLASVGYIITGLQAFELKLNSLADSVTKISNSLSHFTQPLAVDLTAEDEEVLLEEGRQSEFDHTEGVIVEDLGPVAGERPYEDLFKDTEDCGPKVNEGVAK